MTPRVLVVVAALGLALACSSEPESVPPKPPAGAEGSVDGEAAKPDPNAGWRETRSLAPGDADASIVRCQYSGREQFMRRDDCISRGGRIL